MNSVLMVVSSSLLFLSPTQRMLLASRSRDMGGKRERRSMYLSQSRWIPAAQLSNRRSSSATCGEPWLSRPGPLRHPQLDGSCLPSASRRTLDRQSSTARMRPGSALGRPRHSWKRDASGAPCCGENGPGRGLCRLRCPRYRRGAYASHRECRCSGRARSATSTFSLALELLAAPQVFRSRTTSQGGYVNRGCGRHPPTALRVQRRVRRRPGFQPPSLRATARRSHATALEGRRRNVAIISTRLVRKRRACVDLSGRAEIQTDACARRSADLV